MKHFYAVPDASSTGRE